MILVDTGAFVALFDPQDEQHRRCRTVLEGIRDTLHTTLPVLTEAFHILSPASLGAARLRDFVLQGGCLARPMDTKDLTRAFELMEQTPTIRWTGPTLPSSSLRRDSERAWSSPSTDATSAPIACALAIAPTPSRSFRERAAPALFLEDVRAITS